MTDQIARGVVAAHAALSLVPAEHSAVRSVDDITGPEAARLARLTRQMGDVANAVMYATTALEDELLNVAASALAWIQQIEKERAR